MGTVRFGIRGRRASVVALLFVALGVWSSATAAQGPPQATETPSVPDFTGFYALASGDALEGLEPIGDPVRDVIQSHLLPWAKLRMETTDGVAEDPGAVCEPTGIFRYPTQAGNFWWLQTPSKIVIVYRAISTAGVQRVYLDRPHPMNPPLTWSGHSTGRWEGDTLVVDTVGLNDKSWLSPAMEPHTSEVHFMQRIRQVREGRFIEIRYIVEDYKTLTSAFTYTRYYRKTNDPPEQICNESPDIWTEIRNNRLLPLLERSREVR